MNDERQAAAYIGLVILIGLVGLFLTGGIPGLNVLSETSIGLGDIYVDNYRADIYLNGTLAEQFVYRIEASGKYRMLYRTWKIPLSTQNMSVPYVEPLMISSNSGAIPYFKDYRGISQILSAKDSRYRSEVQSLAELDEAGGYYPQRFPSGLFKMNYLFRIHPHLECDQELCHWNLRQADEHIPYRQATIYIHDPDNLTVQFFPHPEMDYSRVGDSWVITGSSPKDAVLEVEMLLKTQASKFIQGFPRQVPDVRSKTLSAQEGGFDLLFILRALVVIFPLLLILIYYRFGKEKRYTVPKVLSTIPANRKPWLVNMVFKGDAYDYSPGQCRPGASPCWRPTTAENHHFFNPRPTNGAQWISRLKPSFLRWERCSLPGLARAAWYPQRAQGREASRSFSSQARGWCASLSSQARPCAWRAARRGSPF